MKLRVGWAILGIIAGLTAGAAFAYMYQVRAGVTRSRIETERRADTLSEQAVLC